MLAVVSDKKEQSDGVTWSAIVVSAQDYFPFGMAMPGRSTTSTYKYGFNGQEKDTEMGAGIYTAEFWQYDARLGRRYNLDPKPNVSISQYACFANNPIGISDPLGDTIDVKNKGGHTLMILDDGKKQRISSTVEKLYEKKVQWFEPNAKNYMKPIYTNPNIGTMDGIIHCSWDDVIDFADKHWVAEYGKGEPGDWKIAKDGGRGFYLATVDGELFWSDAVGQIPFAIATYQFLLKEYGDHGKASRGTVKLGHLFATGVPIPGGGKSAEYDNIIILRGILFAQSRYEVGHPTILKLPVDGEMTMDYIQYEVKTKMVKKYPLRTPVSSEITKKYGY